MKSSESLSNDAEAAVRRRIFRLGPFLVVLGLLAPGKYLIDRWETAVGIQPLDYFLAAALYLFVLGCMYLGYRRALANARKASLDPGPITKGLTQPLSSNNSLKRPR